MKLLVMSDLHLSKKPWQVRKALKMGEDADAVLLAGDLTNDGTPEQMELMHTCISEVLPDTPVLAVAGNHDYPHQPSPMIREGFCDFEALQDWLLTRQPYPYVLDDSGAWTVRMGDVEIIGLNCVWHWRRFKFKNGAQLNWLEEHLKTSDAQWHMILCHAPLLAHNPKRSDTKPYLSRDEKLQRIVDAYKNIIFISGHTHISMEGSVDCVEHDESRSNIYINDGSIRPTTKLTSDGIPEAEPAEGNVVELLIGQNRSTVTGISMKTGQRIARGHYSFAKRGLAMDIEYVKKNATVSGVCRENFYWYFLDGDFYIEGTGVLDYVEDWSYFYDPPLSEYWRRNKPVILPWKELLYQIQHVVIAPGCTELGLGCFENHINLETISIPDTVRKVGLFAFSNCRKLQEVVLPGDVDVIDDYAFHGCVALRRVEIPDTVQIIGVGAFDVCWELADFRMPKQVKRIEKKAFNSCKKLTSVVLPDGLRVIGDQAFWGCESVKRLVIPKSVESIGEKAFWGVEEVIYQE